MAANVTHRQRTDRLQAAPELRRLNAESERRLAERTAQLEATEIGQFLWRRHAEEALRKTHCEPGVVTQLYRWPRRPSLTP